MSNPRKNTRDIFPPTGPKLNAKSWLTEAPLPIFARSFAVALARSAGWPCRAIRKISTKPIRR